MTRSSHHILTAALALVLAAVPQAGRAQEVVQPLPGTTDADRLADTMRQLASNPRNVDALVRAGELSLGLGDLSGAAALFARAEKVDPRNGRMKAGMASILVRSERPGEALRYFAQAEAFGLQPRHFAADRGLAYDLIGEQDRAQRDYRVVLRDAPDDETVRRYALSLGISGQRDLALKQLDPLVAKKDRGAWRARAFILAMNKDVRGAETIVTTMMPGAAAQGLQPFFQRLPLLAPADRAFAVHFGEVHTTPQRIADARMTPPLPVLGVDSSAPVMLAAVQPQPVPQATVQTTRDTRLRGRRDRSAQAGRVEMAAATPLPPPVAARPVVRATPTVQAATTPMTMVQPVPRPSAVASVEPAAAAVSRPTQSVLARTSPNPSLPSQSSPAPAFVQALPSRPAGGVAEANRVSQVAVASSTTAAAVGAGVASGSGVSPVPVSGGGSETPGALPSSIVAQMAALPPSTRLPIVAGLGTSPPVSSSASPVDSASSSGLAAAPVATTAVPGTTAVLAQPAAVTPAAVAPVVAPVEVAASAATAPPATTRAVAASEDSILARIVAGLSIPASELGVEPMVRAAVATPTTVTPVVAAGAAEDGARVVAEAQAKAERDAAAEKAAAETLAATKLADAKAARAKLAADKKVAERKALADRKLLAEKKAAAEKKAIADKEAAEEKRIARANPARIWVQVSTGATEGDLPKAWKGVKAKAPAVFASRAGWTTPWRATNRVLAGPFKTAAEARTFVNALAKEGVSTFSFTSDVGQIITKLPAK